MSAPAALISKHLAVFYSPEFLEHDTGPFHPENSGRLTAVTAALKQAAWANRLDWRIPTPVSQRDVMSLILEHHQSHYVEALQQISERGGGHLDGDTPISKRSYEVALLAVSAWLDGVDYALDTRNVAFVLSRPPGHHAVQERGMGFCLFSNAALAAFYALKQPGIERVAILDWDVHHGNGTQALVQDQAKIAYCSLHQSPCYPGTGYPEERGLHQNVLNIPMAAGSVGADYQQAFEQQVMPFIRRFQPNLLIVSAGYDANHADPLAGISLEPKDFAQFTRYCLSLGDGSEQPAFDYRIVFGLEGGYDYKALSESVLATIGECLGV